MIAGDVGLIEKKLVEPGNLREHLQVREVLRLKVALGFLLECPRRLLTRSQSSRYRG